MLSSLSFPFLPLTLVWHPQYLFSRLFCITLQTPNLLPLFVLHHQPHSLNFSAFSFNSHFAILVGFFFQLFSSGIIILFFIFLKIICFHYYLGWVIQQNYDFIAQIYNMIIFSLFMYFCPHILQYNYDFIVHLCKRIIFHSKEYFLEF